MSTEPGSHACTAATALIKFRLYCILLAQLWTKQRYSSMSGGDWKLYNKLHHSLWVSHKNILFFLLITFCWFAACLIHFGFWQNSSHSRLKDQRSAVVVQLAFTACLNLSMIFRPEVFYFGGILWSCWETLVFVLGVSYFSSIVLLRYFTFCTLIIWVTKKQ